MLKPGIPTVWLVGDSTVRNGRGDGANNQMGWGDELAPYLDLNKVNLVNRAIGGRSSKTYITEGHWDEVLAMIKPGDIVLIQFGHNDGGTHRMIPSRARASLPGVGDETQEIENPILKQHETVHTFGWYHAQVCDRHAREGGDAHSVLADSAEDLEGWQDRAQHATRTRAGRARWPTRRRRTSST